MAAGLWCGLFAGCARLASHTSVRQVTPPPAAQLGSAPGLRVMLMWTAPVDLDLYLTDPTSETVYFGNNPSRSGARLLRDTRCADFPSNDTPAFEVASVSAPTPGHYRIGVDFIDACESKTSSVSFRVVTQYGDTTRETTGSITLEEFQPIVVEFELQRSNGDGPLVLSQEGG